MLNHLPYRSTQPLVIVGLGPIKTIGLNGAARGPFLCHHLAFTTTLSPRGTIGFEGLPASEIGLEVALLQPNVQLPANLGQSALM
jgi:hypothetical protein